MLQRLKEDRFFYEELAGARQAAFNLGLDGSQWLLDHFGVGLGDFQMIATQYMLNKGLASHEWQYQEYQEEQINKYTQLIQKEMRKN